MLAIEQVCDEKGLELVCTEPQVPMMIDVVDANGTVDVEIVQQCEDAKAENDVKELTRMSGADMMPTMQLRRVPGTSLVYRA